MYTTSYTQHTRKEEWTDERKRRGKEGRKEGAKERRNEGREEEREERRMKIFCFSFHCRYPLGTISAYPSLLSSFFVFRIFPFFRSPIVITSPHTFFLFILPFLSFPASILPSVPSFLLLFFFPHLLHTFFSLYLYFYV